MLTLTLPWPPSNNHQTQMGRGRIFPSEQTRSYKKTIFYQFYDLKHETFTGPLRVSIHAFPPDCRRRDWDNLPKVPLDALKFAKIYQDDSQIDEASVKLHRGLLVPEGVLIIILEEISTPIEDKLKISVNDALKIAQGEFCGSEKG